ncbi:MAG: hypothetical protein ACXVXP_02275 [Mycobacteriaceae bacterium]
MEFDSGIRMTTVPDSVRCGCGEVLVAGERAGIDADDRSVLCLWCLADRQAGRALPRRREPTAPPMPSFAHPVGKAIGRQKQPRRRSPSTVWSFLIALVLVVGGLWLHEQLTGFAGTDVAGIPVVPADLQAPSFGNSIAGSARPSWPPVPADAASQPLGEPPPQQSRSTRYAFMDTVGSVGGEPVRWDPCRPIHVVVNSADAPAGADKLLRNGLAEVSRDTGLRFVLDGPTNEAPSSNRPPTQPGRYGNRWSPVLVAWTNPRTVPGLSGPVAGLAGPVGAPYSTRSEKHWVSGIVYLDGPAFSEVLARPDSGWWQAQAIVLHELGHLVGLAHVNDTSQLMAPRNGRRLMFATGDLEGLRRLGGGPCFSQ